MLECLVLARMSWSFYMMARGSNGMPDGNYITLVCVGQLALRCRTPGGRHGLVGEFSCMDNLREIDMDYRPVQDNPTMSHANYQIHSHLLNSASHLTNTNMFGKNPVHYPVQLHWL